jgi:hypothetical protein
MKLAMLIALLPIAASCARQAALAPTPEPSSVQSGKRAQFLAGSKGWLDGFVIRRFPGTESPCLAVYAPALNGAVMLGEIDSLRLDRHPGFGTGSALPPAVDTLPAPQWQTFSASELKSREPSRCASYVKRASGPAT